MPKLRKSPQIIIFLLLHFSLDKFLFDQHSFPSLSFRIKQIAVWNRVLPAKALIMDHVLGSQVLLLVTRYSQPGEVTDPNWHTRTNIWLVCATFNPDQIRKITAFKSCSMERGSRSTVLCALRVNQITKLDSASSQAGDNRLDFFTCMGISGIRIVATFSDLSFKMHH